MVSHQRQRSPKRDFSYVKVTFSTSQNPAEFTPNIEKYYSVASQQNLPFIKLYFMSKEIVAWLASLHHDGLQIPPPSLPTSHERLLPLPVEAFLHPKKWIRHYWSLFLLYL
jgi:hypothetical protein